MAQVLKVRLVVSTDVGEYSVDVEHPPPGGGNPRFVTAQLASAVEVLGRRAARILEAEFGEQHDPDLEGKFWVKHDPIDDVWAAGLRTEPHNILGTGSSKLGALADAKQWLARQERR